jgi:hypothetical protein
MLALLHYLVPAGGSIKYSLNLAGFVVFLLPDGSWALALVNADPEDTLTVTLELA